MAEKSSCLKSIAYELNLSINTVSRALRDCSDISDATKEKVRKKAFEMGYLPNSISQFIKRDGKKLIAIVLNNFKNIYFQIVCDKLVSLLAAENFDFTIVYSPTKKLTIDLLKQCISERVDGIITLLEPEDSIIDHAKLNHIPIIMVGRHLDKDYIDEVYTDDEMGGTLAANYLANYHQINKFIYVKMPNVECSKRRQMAFTEAISSVDSKNEVLILEPKQVNQSMLTLINKGYLGIFCFSDEIAYDVLYTLNKLVPNVRKVYPHLHIVGFDAVSTHMHGLIDITSVSFDYDAICKEALRMLKDRFHDIKRDKQSMMFTVSLHARKIFG